MAVVLFPVLAVLSFSGVAAAGPAPKPAAAAPTPCAPLVNTPKDQVLQSIDQVSKNDCGAGVTNLASTIVNVLSQIVGVLAVIMVIWAGFKYITSGGDSNKVASAKTTLIYALIGLVVVALAQIIVHFAINTATGAATTAACPVGQVANSAGTCVVPPK